MKAKSNIARLTLDLSKEDHKELKTLASFYGTTMKELFIKSIPYIKNQVIKNYKKKTTKTKESSACHRCDQVPNEDTLESIKNVEAGKNLTEYKDINDFFKKFGI